MRLLAVLIVGLAGLAAFAQEETPATQPEELQSTQTVSYYLAPVEGSGVSGYLQVTEEVSGGSKLVVTLQGVREGQRYALALFEGDCGPDRELVAELEPVPNIEGDPYSSLSESEMPFAAFAEGDYFLYVYGGETLDGDIVACGEVGQGANASGFAPADAAENGEEAETAAPQAAEPRTEAQESEESPETDPEAAGEEFRSPRTASYVLSPVEGSGVSGNLQFVEQLEGGTRITVSLSGIPGTGSHAVVLYQGDCGPDRPDVLRLTNVDDSDGDPYASVTDSELNFDTLTQGDHFAYVFESEPGSGILACGEVDRQ